MLGRVVLGEYAEDMIGIFKCLDDQVVRMISLSTRPTKELFFGDTPHMLSPKPFFVCSRPRNKL